MHLFKRGIFSEGRERIVLYTPVPVVLIEKYTWQEMLHPGGRQHLIKTVTPFATIRP
jgi:hypothetical protein